MSQDIPYSRRINVALDESFLEAECFRYLASHVALDGGIDGEVKFRMSKIGKL